MQENKHSLRSALNCFIVCLAIALCNELYLEDLYYYFNPYRCEYDLRCHEYYNDCCCDCIECLCREYAVDE